MMKRSVAAIVFVFGVAYSVLSQPYGNEWVDFNKSYYKINIGAEGIYRLTYDKLNAVGFPVGSIDPRRIQLFHRGQEIAINVVGEGDAIFDPSDYIEFYGQPNDGTLDNEMYINPSAQPHSYYNLYSDTTAYFLTYNIVATNGKRMSSNTPFTGAAIDTYHLNEKLNVYTDEYSLGFTLSSYASLSAFDVGEGFTGPRITENTNPVKDIVITGINNAIVSGPEPVLKMLLVGRNDLQHNITVEVGPSAGALTVLNTYNFTRFNTLLIDTPIAWSNISGAGELTIRITVNANGGLNSNVSVSYVNLMYPENFDMNSVPAKSYNLQTQASGGDNIQINNTPANALVYDITDPVNVKKVIDTEVAPNIIKCGFQDATSPRKLWVTEPVAIEPVIVPVSFRPIDVSANFIVISHTSLMKPAGGFPDAVRAYAGYRSSATGGGFDTLVVDIQQLYDQFSYGETTPLAIYHFMKYLVNNGNPDYLFLIGKALLVSNKFYRRPKSDFTYYDLVPTAGDPGSDILYTAGLNGAVHEAAVPTGRLGASSPEEVINYLGKVIEKESTPFTQLWRKNLLHLSGGNNEAELAEFKGYVDSYKSIASGNYLGGETTTVSKTTSTTVEFINVSEEVNAGLNQITFFGHSAPNITDIDIGFVSDPVNGYNNKGKYPIIVMNGCNAGNIYNDSYIFGEDWVLTPDKGATDVIAHSSYGFSNILNVWTSLFYSVGYGDINYMDQSIGNIMQEVGKQMSAQLGGVVNYYYIAQIQQMGLQGDPAIKLFGTQLPDYEISSNNIEEVGLTSLGITAEADSFALNLAVRNFSAYLNDSLEVVVRRTLPDQTLITYDTVKYAPVRYMDTLQYVINNNYANNYGINSFEVILDPTNKLNELDKQNNRDFFSLNIPLSGSVNLQPQHFSIVNTQPVDLVAQVGRQPSEERIITFELDSVRSFDSNFIQNGNASGTLVSVWQGGSLLPDVPANDTTAYYWRTKYSSLQTGEADVWNESSFTYIKDGGEGWAQVAFDQFKDNSLSGMYYNNVIQPIKFEETPLNIEVKTFGSSHPTLTYLDVQLLIDGQAFIYGTSFQSCSNNRLAIVAFNNEIAAPYAPIFGGQTDPWTCGRSPQVINIVGEANQSGKTLDEVLDAIQPNDYVLIFTIGNFDFNALPASALTKLENIGADNAILGSKAIDEPYILYGKKGVGTGNAIAEIVADPASLIPANEQEISYTGQVVGIKSNGSMTSTLIGPANAWSKLSFATRPLEPNDQFTIDIIGKTLDGQAFTLATGIQANETLLHTIDANQYPYIQLKYNVADNVDKTPVQLRKWLVNYDPSAEGVIAFLGNSKNNQLNIELQEGDSVSTQFGFINLSDKFFKDSLIVDYTVFNTTQRNPLNKSLKILAPIPNDTTYFTIWVKTTGLVGVNNLSVAVNNMVEPEQTYINNTLSLTNYIQVNKDDTNPLLDVSIDGRYIFDGEIVSPNPTIKIRILDQNPLLYKTDTSGIDVYLTRPCENCIKERLSLAGNFIPATKENPFEMNFTFNQLEDGIYTLSAQVVDASGNQAGLEPYVIHFEVINKATVTNFYPYPNPFSTSVRFVFTLTGNEIPDGVMIRILTVSGKVVRTITQDEIGTLHIGNNQTEYAWDGRDEFGDPLANGVYLYKVTLEINGKRVDLRPSAGDKGFKNGYGKLYLLR